MWVGGWVNGGRYTGLCVAVVVVVWWWWLVVGLTGPQPPEYSPLGLLCRPLARPAPPVLPATTPVTAQPPPTSAMEASAR